MNVIRAVLALFPYLKYDLRKAHIKSTPETFIKKILQQSLTVALAFFIFAFFMLSVFRISLWFVLPITLVAFILVSVLLVHSPKQYIVKRQRDLDKEVLFAGRYLLVKIHSGRPLLNALIDGSKSYGVAGGYFKEIVDDITLGTPIEKAIDNAIKYSPSEKFRKILFHMYNAIKIGVDVSSSLESALDEIAQEQLVEIQRYGKKLNSLALFYMLLAVVMPSLGMAMFVVVGTFMNIQLSTNTFAFVLVILVVLQFVFISIFRATRMTVNV